MRILKIDKYRVTKRKLAEAVAVLRAGGVVVHPTESSYGLAVDPANREAVRRLFELKGRPDDKPVLVVAASVGQAEQNVVIHPVLKKLVKRYWPGPLTVIGHPLSIMYVRGLYRFSDVAVRVPASAWARALAAELGRPITSTSANRSNDPPAYSLAAVRRSFVTSTIKPDLMLDAGSLSIRPLSTIVRERRGRLEVLRPGLIVIPDQHERP